MISTILGSIYLSSVGVITYHVSQIKLLNDIHQEINGVR